MKLAREQWRLPQAALPLQRLIFIAESAITTNMTRLYGRAMLGSRCLDKVPRARRGFTNLLGVIRSEGSGVCMVIEGSVNALVFRTYTKECSLPTLREGDMVVKGKSSYLLRQEYAIQLKEKLWSAHLWSPSYCVVSCSGAPLEVIKEYVRKQRQPSHPLHKPLPFLKN